MSTADIRRAAFLLFLATGAIFFLLRINTILPLFLDADLRVRVPAMLQDIADREGWLLSDIALQRFDSEILVITHRMHLRGEDPKKCYRIALFDSSLQPCAGD